MGTTVTVEVVRPGHDAAIDRAFAWFRVVEDTCTRFDTRSELWQLTTRVGDAVPVSTLLFEAIQFARHVAEVTGGAFDPAIGAAMQQHGFNREHRTGVEAPLLREATPDSQAATRELQGAAVRPTYRDVVLDADRHTVTLLRPLLLDLGAVAKGLAIDLAARELESVEDFAIDAGGDLYLGGLNHDRQPWTVGIRHPRESGEVVNAVRVSNRAVCTSGDYERRSEQGHHLIDPATGAAADRVASVTVIAASAMLADALSTAAFVLGSEDGLRLLGDMGVEGLIVGRDQSQAATQGWPRA